jgi:hypothetical protein
MYFILRTLLWDLGGWGIDVVYFCSQAPVVISRDHHDVSGTDSPYRETSNITDGSAFTAGEGSEGFQNTSNLTAQGPRKETLVWGTGLNLGWYWVEVLPITCSMVGLIVCYLITLYRLRTDSASNTVKWRLLIYIWFILTTVSVVKAITVTGRGGLRDFEAPTFSRQSVHRWRWGCQPYASAALYPQGHSAAGRIRLIEKSNDIGNGTRDLPACSIVAQPTTLSRDPTVSSSDYTALQDDWRIINWKGRWKKQSCLNSRYCPGIWVEALNKTTNISIKRVGLRAEVRARYLRNTKEYHLFMMTN